MKVSYAQAEMVTGLTGVALRYGVVSRLEKRACKENIYIKADAQLGEFFIWAAVAYIALFAFSFHPMVHAMSLFNLAVTDDAVLFVIGLLALGLTVVTAVALGLCGSVMKLRIATFLRLYIVKHRDEEVEL